MEPRPSCDNTQSKNVPTYYNIFKYMFLDLRFFSYCVKTWRKGHKRLQRTGNCVLPIK